MSADYIPVADATQIEPGKAIAVTAGEREVAIFNIAGTFHAIDNCCPHQGGPLAEGYIEGETVTCPWHAWCFKLDDGKMTLGDYAEVDVFDVRVDGSRVSISPVPRGG